MDLGEKELCGQGRGQSDLGMGGVWEGQGRRAGGGIGGRRQEMAIPIPWDVQHRRQGGEETSASRKGGEKKGKGKRGKSGVRCFGGRVRRGGVGMQKLDFPATKLDVFAKTWISCQNKFLYQKIEFSKKK